MYDFVTTCENNDTFSKYLIYTFLGYKKLVKYSSYIHIRTTNVM